MGSSPAQAPSPPVISLTRATTSSYVDTITSVALPKACSLFTLTFRSHRFATRMHMFLSYRF